MLSKGDLVHDDALVADLEAKLEARGIEARRISAAGSFGLDALLHEAFDAVEEERARERAARAQSTHTHTPTHNTAAHTADRAPSARMSRASSRLTAVVVPLS